MFNNLTASLSQTLRNISGLGRLTESNIKNTLREVRIALLEADVALPVVREFIEKIKKNALGKDVNKSLTPGQELIKIVRNELILALGKDHIPLQFNVQPPAVMLILGLQGVGKTTSVAKLSKLLRDKYKKKILVVSIDIYRPAAINQLEKLAQQVNVNFFPSDNNQNPIDIVQNALKAAQLKCYDILLIDTAGRLHIDQIMMNEIQKVYTLTHPTETLLVVDAMMGQDAVNVAQAFNIALPLTGIILTKVDGDMRGGAALSISYCTKKPIKFIGVGEKTDSLELFYPDRIASRILGMDDVLSLIEYIENNVDQVKAEKIAKKIKSGTNFDFNDFREHLKQIHNMDNIKQIMQKIPSINTSKNATLEVDKKLLIHMEAIINSMTLQERIDPTIIKGVRKRRIAAGSGTKIQDVNRLLKQFDDMKRFFKKIKKGNVNKILRSFGMIR